MTSRKRSQVTLDGVIIAWHDTRRMVASEPDDCEMLGSFDVRISAEAATLAAIRNSYVCARTLQRVADLGDLLCQHSDSMMRPEGLSSLGSVVLRIYRGDRKCDAVPVSDLSHLDPSRYQGDPVAARSIAWMRDIALAIQRFHSALIDGISETVAYDELWEAVRQTLHTGQEEE
jgi:hypothetical protein